MGRSSAEPAGASTDEELMRRAAAGDSAAFDEFGHRFRPRLSGLARRLTKNTSDAEELVQETLLKAWRNAARFDATRGCVATFVFTIARNVATDQWRRSAVRPVTEAMPEHGEPAGRVAAPEMSDALITGLAVADALGRLSSTHREVVELAYFGGLSQSELAERLGIPLGTVKTRTFHALKALRAELSGVHQ